MAFNGSGTFIRGDGTRTGSNTWQQARDAGADIEALDHDTHDQDIANALSNCITKDGQQTLTANIPFGGYKISNLGAGTARTDSINFGQVQDNSAVYLGTTGGSTTAYTTSISPAPAAYANGQRFIALANATNTGTTTLAVGALAALAVKKVNTSGSLIDIVAGDIRANQVIDVVYSSGGGGQWILLNPSIPDGLARSGTNSDITNLTGIALSTWTPTVAGNGSMTISALQIRDANYCRIGPYIHFKVAVTFTIGGTVNTTIGISQPVGGILDNVNTRMHCHADDGGGGIITSGGLWNYDGTQFTVVKAGLANWTLGANASIHIDGKYRFV